MEQPRDLARVAASLEPGGRLVGAQALQGGVSADVILLEIATAAGGSRRVVYRRHRPAGLKQHAAKVVVKEHGVLAALHAHGLPVPEPYLCVDTGDLSSSYLLMEWIDGSTHVAPSDLRSAIDQMAWFLSAMHAITPSSLGLPALDPIEDPAGAIGGFIDRLPTSEATERVRAAVAARRFTLRPQSPVLVHGDYWPGNTMWRDGQLVAVLDWEDACLGDPLADLATARVELLCQYGPQAMHDFTVRYLGLAGGGIVVPGGDPLLIWDLYVSAAALATMGDWGLPPDEEARRRRLTEAFFQRAAGELA